MPRAAGALARVLSAISSDTLGSSISSFMLNANSGASSMTGIAYCRQNDDGLRNGGLCVSLHGETRGCSVERRKQESKGRGLRPKGVRCLQAEACSLVLTTMRWKGRVIPQLGTLGAVEAGSLYCEGRTRTAERGRARTSASTHHFLAGKHVDLQRNRSEDSPSRALAVSHWNGSRISRQLFAGYGRACCNTVPMRYGECARSVVEVALRLIKNRMHAGTLRPSSKPGHPRRGRRIRTSEHSTLDASSSPKALLDRSFGRLQQRASPACT